MKHPTHNQCAECSGLTHNRSMICDGCKPLYDDPVMEDEPTSAPRSNPGLPSR